MSEKLKQKIMEFVALAKECPESLQAKCFELLFADHLQQLRPKVASLVEDAKPSKPTGDDAKKGGEDRKASQQAEAALPTRSANWSCGVPRKRLSTARAKC